MKLSVVLATRNEEENVARCLASVKDIASEIIIFDEYSTDKTVEIAKKFGAKVFLEEHHDIFHITKQKALEKAKGEWILQLDADEVVTDELSEQIMKVVHGTPFTVNNPLFERHQKLIEQRDLPADATHQALQAGGSIGNKSGQIVGYFIPRLNMFLGRPLTHAGVYPDGVIRLVKNGYARFPQKSVHEQIELDGEVRWLSGDLLHYDSPTMKRYLMRLNRYTDLKAQELAEAKVSKSIFTFMNYVLLIPLSTFLNLYFRHAGFKDGPTGFLWSFFSALHFPISYFKYITSKVK